MGDSLLAGAVVGAAAQRHADHTAGERHEQRVVIPIQLEAEHPPVLPLHVASRNTEGKKKQNPTVKIRRFRFHFIFKSALQTTGTVWKLYRNPAVSRSACRSASQGVQSENKGRHGKKKKHPLELYRVMQSATIDQSVGGQGRSRHKTGSTRERKIPSKRTKTVRNRREKWTVNTVKGKKMECSKQKRHTCG